MRLNKCAIAGLMAVTAISMSGCSFNFRIGTEIPLSSIKDDVEETEKETTKKEKNKKEETDADDLDEEVKNVRKKDGTLAFNKRSDAKHDSSRAEVTVNDYYDAVSKLYDTHDYGIGVTYSTGEVGQLNNNTMTIFDTKNNCMSVGFPTHKTRYSDDNYLIYADLVPDKANGTLKIEDLDRYFIIGDRAIQPADIMVDELDNVVITKTEGDKVYFNSTGSGSECYVVIDEDNYITDYDNGYYSMHFVYRDHSKDYAKVAAEYERIVSTYLGDFDTMEAAIQTAVGDMIDMYHDEYYSKEHGDNNNSGSYDRLIEESSPAMQSSGGYSSNSKDSVSEYDSVYGLYGNVTYGSSPVSPISDYLHMSTRSDNIDMKLRYIKSLKGVAPKSDILDFSKVDTIKDLPNESHSTLKPGESVNRCIIIHEDYKVDYYYCIVTLTNNTTQDQLIFDCPISDVLLP